MTTLETCPHCGGMAMTESICPLEVACNTCGALPGRKCRRPSGHVAMTLHAERAELAEELDRRNGLSYR
jgi:hypothetical protein